MTSFPLMLMTLSVGLTLQGPPAGDPQVAATLSTDTTFLGDRFTLTVTVRGVAGANVIFPSLPDSGAITSLEPPEVGGQPGSDRRTAEYVLVAWETGDLELPSLELEIARDETRTTLPLPDRSIHVRSVLPSGADPDTLGWMPARGVLGPNWSLAEKLLAAALVLSAIAAAWLVARRRGVRSGPPQPPPIRSPRDRALEALDGLESSDLLAIGELKAFYSELAAVLRRFLADSEDAWGLDLTTAELLIEVARDGVAEGDISTLADLLVEADLVKFARRRPPAERARAALSRGRRWVEDFERILPAPVESTPEDGREGSSGAEPADLEPEAVDDTELGTDGAGSSEPSGETDGTAEIGGDAEPERS